MRCMRGMVLLLLVACDYTTADGTSGSNSSDAPDAGTRPAPDAAVTPPFGTCRTTVTGVGTGNHNAGMDCQGVCHNHGFTLSGTVFTSAGGGTAVVGASISVKD